MEGAGIGKKLDTNSRVPLSQAELSLWCTEEVAQQIHLWVTLLGNHWHLLHLPLPRQAAHDPEVPKGRSCQLGHCLSAATLHPADTGCLVTVTSLPG